MAERKNTDNVPKQGRNTSVDWRARQKRQRLAGAGRLILGVVVLGVLTGLGIVYKDTLMGFFKEKQTAQKPPTPPPPEPKKVELPPEPKVEPPPEPKKVEPPPEPKAETKKVVPEFDEAEEKRAKQLLSDGQAKMGKLAEVVRNNTRRWDFDFEGAKKLFEEAATLRASEPTHKQAEDWVKRATEYQMATAHIDITDFARVDESYVLTMDNGNSFRGIKLSEDNDMVEMQVVPEHNPATLGKSKLKFPRSSITKEKAVPLTERQGTFRDLLGQLESGSMLNGVADYYDLVYLSKRLALGNELLGYLDRAYKAAPQGRLGDAFRKVVVDRAIERASLLAAAGRKSFAEGVLSDLVRTLPDYQVAMDEADAMRVKLASMKSGFKSTIKLVKKPAAPAQTTEVASAPKPSARELAAEASNQGGGEEVVIDNSGIKGNAANASLVDEANKEFDLAMKSYKNFRGGKNAALKDALKHFDNCIDLYDKALEKDPNNQAIEGRMQEASMLRYGAMKYQTL